MSVHFQSATQRRQRLSRNLVPEKEHESRSVSVNVENGVQLLDVTSWDIRCVLDANPGIGDTVSFGVQLNGVQTGTISGIVHWKELRRDGYEVGLYLPAGLSSDLWLLVTDGQRQSNRYRCRRAGRLRVGSRQCEAVVVNYSWEGIGVQTEAYCKVDERVTFEWADDHARHEITGQVLWQIEQQNGVLLGCQTAPGMGYRIAGLRG